jgi:ATP-binding cassette subfamily B protein
MTLGQFTAFNSYLAILIFPVIMIGFMSNVIAQSSASYMRIGMVLAAPPARPRGTLVADLRGDITLSHVTLTFGEKDALRDVSLRIKSGTRAAIIGPTAAGKTQLLYLLAGLIAPSSGTVEYDGRNIEDYDKTTLHSRWRWSSRTPRCST